MGEQTRIVIADDHPIFRSGLRQLIEKDPTFCVVGEAGDGRAALDIIVDLAPDVVVANAEENRSADIAALAECGVAVWVTAPETLPAALTSLDRMLTHACGLARPSWLDAAVQAWQPADRGARRRAVVPIWRRPWMVLGRDTFAGDVLARLGVANLYAGHAERYPKIPLDDLLAAGPELVVLPDEPYRFTAGDGPECFPGLPAALVSGRHLTWYGPSLAEAPGVLAVQLATVSPFRLAGQDGDAP